MKRKALKKRVTVEGVLNMLPQLTKTDLKRVRIEINSLLAATQDVNDDFEVMFYDTLCRLWQMQGLGKPTPYPVFKKSQLYPQFTDKIEHLKQFIHEQVGDEKSRVLKITRLCLHCYIKKARNDFVPRDFTWAITNIEQIPEAVDRYYPGYSSQRLLSWLIKEK